ncbi:MAG: hypothetical protein HZB51_00410 [Chloroflexi bacterium]|nr:hypothetical protein [Chloroflexota bacterium]
MVDQSKRYVGMVAEVNLLQHLLLPDHEKGETIADIVGKDCDRLPDGAESVNA